MHRTAYNSTDRPVVIDDEGRIIAGRDYGTVDDSKEEVKEALALDYLILVEVGTGADINPAAAEAARRTTELNSTPSKTSKNKGDES